MNAYWNPESWDAWPKHGLESVPNCPVCGSNRRVLLYDNLRDRVFFCAPGTWDLYRCGDCRCVYLDPRPSRDFIHLAYKKYYTHTQSNSSDVLFMGRFRKLRRALANGYRNWRLGTHFLPANRCGVAVAILLPGIRQKLEYGLRNLPRPAQGAHLLDIGFGSGAFLELAKNAGWNVAGVDPDLVAVNSAIKRSLNVRLGGVEAFADMPESFDVITMNHVIEHVHDTYKTLQIVYELLKPGGFLWLSTPNIQSLGHVQYGPNWRDLDPPRHLVLFNWEALEELLQKIGFRIIYKYKRNWDYAGMAARSEAIAKSPDAYFHSKVRLRHRLYAASARVHTLFRPHGTESITLKAYKPQ